MTCNKNHRYLPKFSSLQEAQDNQNGNRHICAGCAYEEGLRDGRNGEPKNKDLSHLPESQAGTVRHKDAMEAYMLGYTDGQKNLS